MLRRLDVDRLTALDDRGRFVKRKIIFPVFLPPPDRGDRGHWFYTCLKPHAKRIEVGDSAGAHRLPAAQILARLWNDLCMLKHGYHHSAEKWEVIQVDIGRQKGNWECGFYMVTAISAECANSQGPLQPEEVDQVRRLMAMDIVNGTIVDNGARLRRTAPLPRRPLLDTRMPAGSPANVRNTGLGHSYTPSSANQTDQAPLGIDQHPSSCTSGANAASPPGQESIGRDHLTVSRRRQWTLSGIRVRTPDRRGWRRPRRAGGRKAPPLQGNIDCPDVSTVPLEDSEGIPLQVLSLNLGIAGFKRSLRTLSSFLHPTNIAVVHLQEARLKAHELPKWRKIAQTHLSKYALYAHCYHGRRNTAVLTLVRKEIAKWCSPLHVNSIGDELSGRLLALRYAPPNILTPLVVANVWMPHSGYPPQTIRDAHEAFGRLTAGWRAAGYRVLAASAATYIPVVALTEPCADALVPFPYNLCQR